MTTRDDITINLEIKTGSANKALGEVSSSLKDAGRQARALEKETDRISKALSLIHI